MNAKPYGDDSKYLLIASVECRRATDKAILVELDGADHWIPLSQIHDDSEVFTDSDAGNEGDLIISIWIAKKKGLVDDCAF